MLSDDQIRWTAEYRRDEDVGRMARELLAARMVIKAARHNCPVFDGPPCPCLLCGALRDYDEATR